ncbi:hypothetical protein B0H17DRAFT_1207586 [Mycena rosella]|uniref:F-box domain-containing protein n=1 Tax=Mycena rosella TaxID=1033263 RepID=A0AAD7GCA5_MYCRO|nr:hypothetical protein B0H17DRAFT_1207586 [Mycena rosella]
MADFDGANSPDSAQNRCLNTYPPLPALPSRLLSTNDPPSDDEAAAIRDIRDAAHTRISDLDASIATLKGILESLETTRKAAAKYLHLCRSTLSIRCLPEDVLCEIFSHAVRCTQRSQRCTMDKSPWLLGRVCSRWRAISILHSALWANIDSELPARIRAVHLERSNACGLKVRLLNHDIEAVDSIIACSSRWETVDLRSKYLPIMLPILDRVRGRVPMLRELAYIGDSSSAFEIAPKLFSVAIYGDATLDLPWAQLTRLRQPILNVDGPVYNHLASAYNLVELSLTSRVDYPSTISAHELPHRMMKLPFLRALFIDDGVFLELFVLPALEDIFISSKTLHLSSLIERSGCSLRRFTTVEYHIRFETLRSILERTPRLRELRLGRIYDTDSLIRYLTISPTSDPACPTPCTLLRSISMCDITTERVCSLVAEMVESRFDNTTCARLSLLAFSFQCKHLNRVELAAQERLHTRGIDAQ